MEQFREWIISVVAVSMLVGMVRLVIPAGSVGKLASFIGGLLLLLALLRPLPDIEPTALLPDVEMQQEAFAQRQGELTAEVQSQLEARIAEETAAYISNKARGMGMELSVRIETEINPEGIPVPAKAVLSGPYTQALAAYMEQELGIPAERQVWNEKER